MCLACFVSQQKTTFALHTGMQHKPKGQNEEAEAKHMQEAAAHTRQEG